MSHVSCLVFPLATFSIQLKKAILTACSFTATYFGRRVILRWSTQTDEEIVQFWDTELTKLEVTMKCRMPCSISLVSLDAQLDVKVLYKNYNKGFIIVNQT